jgi:hypothetical protein
MEGEMALNQSKFNVDWCVTGEKQMQELDPTYKVKESRLSKRINGRIISICEMCEQPVEVKKDGFFKRHKASSAGYKAFGDKRSGTPPRVRRPQ